ncbi:MAG: hypothetical protein AAFV49_05575 [Pseudomonadota bacterium]
MVIAIRKPIIFSQPEPVYSIGSPSTRMLLAKTLRSRVTSQNR